MNSDSAVYRPESIRSYRDAAVYCIERLEANDFAAYVVGGAVRDIFLERKISDLDLATSALPEEIHRVFSNFRMIDTGIEHGTVTLILPAANKVNFHLEVTTFRVESTYSDARHPDQVAFTNSLTEDLARRDLTINAMAWHPKNGIVDPYGGQKDLARRILKAVGQPEKRFQEDALRILRTLRLAAELGFSIENHTEKALLDKQQRLLFVAPERLYVEFSRLLTGNYAVQVIDKYWQVIAVFLPEFNFFANSEFRDQYLPQLNQLSQLFVERLAYLAAVFQLEKKTASGPIPDQAVSICRRLKCSKKMTEELVLLSGYSAKSITATKISVDAVRQKLAAADRSFEDILKLKKLLGQPDTQIKKLREIDLELQAANLQGLKSLAIDGHDLIAMGFRGESVGTALNRLYEAVLCEGLANKKSALLQRAETYKDLQN